MSPVSLADLAPSGSEGSNTPPDLWEAPSSTPASESTCPKANGNEGFGDNKNEPVVVVGIGRPLH